MRTTKPTTFAELLSLWKSPTELSAAVGLPYVNAQVMRHRRSIAPEHWPAFIAAAKAKGVELTTDDLLAMKFRPKAGAAA